MAANSEEGLLDKPVKIKRYRGKCCVAYGCKQRSDEGSKQRGITFHAFPWSKPDVVRKWERAMHRKDFNATIHSRVCSTHFAPECFDRIGARVCLKAGSVPTVFDLPGHPVRTVRHKTPPKEEPVCGLTATETFRPTASLSVEASCEPVALAPSYNLCNRNGSLADGTVAASAESGLSNVTIQQPQRFIEFNWHSYSLPSRKVLKQHLCTMESALAEYKDKVKTLAQKNRRLQSKVESLKQQLLSKHQREELT